MRTKKLHIGVLGSGAGSNMQSVVDAVQVKKLNAEINIVISDVAGATILDRARTHNIPAHWLDCSAYRTKLDGEAERACIQLMNDHGVDTVVLAGFMRIVKRRLLDAFPNRVLNIHPALLPAFPGLYAWKQALDYGVKVAGCTVHFVDDGTDTGPIILQKTVPVLEGDTPETLHARIQEQEHLAYPEALRLISAGCLRVEGRRVIMNDSTPDASAR
ncbi:MAG: phosphoribosylglycinamide formyltransferase [Kiritimatiellaeota bacterium]|nr:phosphoribosylglycinamide formyltransferase [Kiritimatiellota bacterium]